MHDSKFSYNISWSTKYQKRAALPTSFVVPPDNVRIDIPYHFRDREKYQQFRSSMVRRLHIPTRDRILYSSTDQNEDYEIRYSSYFDKDIIIGAQHSVIRGECDAKDEKYVAFLKKASSLFEKNSARDIEIIDLKTQKKVGEEQIDWRYTLDFQEWCGKTDNRFLVSTKWISSRMDLTISGHFGPSGLSEIENVPRRAITRRTHQTS